MCSSDLDGIDVSKHNGVIKWKEIAKNKRISAWRLYHTFLQGDRPFSVAFRSGGCARAHPLGVAPEASEECFDSFEVLVPFVMARPVWLFPHANWSLPGCLVRSQVLGLVC